MQGQVSLIVYAVLLSLFSHGCIAKSMHFRNLVSMSSSMLPHRESEKLSGNSPDSHAKTGNLKNDAGDCVICMMPLFPEDGFIDDSDSIITTPCNHKFHRDCIAAYFKKKIGERVKMQCPLCNQPIQGDEYSRTVEEIRLSRLSTACSNGNLEDVRKAVAHAFESLGSNGKNCVHLAAENGQVHVVQFLIDDPNCNIFALDILRQNALHLAAENNQVEVVNFLLESTGLDVNQGNVDGNTALHLASAEGHAESVQALLACGRVDVNALNMNYYSPLMYAARDGHVKVVKMLLANNAIDISPRVRGKYTASDLATNNGHHNAASIIKEHASQKGEKADPLEFVF